MSESEFFMTPESQVDEMTGRFIVTFRDNAEKEALEALHDLGGVSGLPSTADFDDRVLETSALDDAGGGVFHSLGVAVVTLDEGCTASDVMGPADRDSAILAIEPERMHYALTLPVDYLRGYRDAIDHILAKAEAGIGAKEATPEVAATFSDDSQATWGLHASGVLGSPFTGANIKVAVLDTGMDFKHPDFKGRTIISKSFYAGETEQDALGHGTHCVGTACGGIDRNGRRYGVASESRIFVGKVLGGPRGSGPTSGILAGIDWAVNNKCPVISMSLGNRVPTPSVAYDAVGRRALQKGCLIIAAAGNHRIRGNFDGTIPGTIGQPANSKSILAVASVDNRLQPAGSSCEEGQSAGAEIDVAGPGVRVYSSWPKQVPPNRYHTISGTSMATPHVAGIAALYAEGDGVRGDQLRQLIKSRARSLPLPSARVGRGLVQAS